VWSYKVGTLLVGYPFARLGYALFLQGVKGEFNFGMELKGAKATMASASPGLFLILMGTAIISVGLYRGLDLQIERTSPTPAALSSPRATPASLEETNSTSCEAKVADPTRESDVNCSCPTK
jgi:hypothetical protein